MAKTKNLAFRLRHKITIQSITEAQDTYGEPIKTWAAFDTVRASIEPLNGKEYFTAQQLDSEVSIRIRIRYLAGVTTKMRVLFGTRTFDIKSIITPSEINRDLILMCTE